jgi:hypothetical protein
MISELALCIVTLFCCAAPAPTTPGADLSEEFQKLPPVDIHALNPYSLAILRQVVARAVALEGLELRGRITVFSGKLVITTNMRGRTKDSISQALRSRLAPFVTSAADLDIYCQADNVRSESSAATAILIASDLRPAFLNGSIIDYDKAWAKCVEVAGTIKGVDLNGATLVSTPTNKSIVSRWATPPFTPEGFVAQEQLVMAIKPHPQGKEFVLTIDTKIRLRRESSRPWIVTDLDSGILGISAPNQSIATQDKCMVALSSALKR